MELHYETVSPLLVKILKELNTCQLLKDFVLVGGTCLSLQLGHRRSIDIDLFTDLEYGTMPIAEIKSYLQQTFPYCENLESLNNRALGYSLRIGYSKNEIVKLDLFYTDPFIFPKQEQDGIRLADIREIAAMKMGAISNDVPRQKDLWDVHELLERYSLNEMIQWGVKRNEFAVTKDNILNGFSKMDEVLECPEGIDCFRGKYWELVKDDLRETVEEYKKEK